jgi:hypothetical protein
MTSSLPPPPSGHDPAQRPPPDVDTLLRRLPADRDTLANDSGWVTVAKPITQEVLLAHARGDLTLGAFPGAGGVAHSAVLDIDNHPADGVVDPAVVAANEQYARKKHAELLAMGVHAVLVRGHNAGSFHIRFFVRPTQAARLGRWLRRFVRDKGELQVDTFPSKTGGGNAVRLPGRHHRRPDQWSAVWNPTDGVWEPWPAAWEMLSALPDNDPELFPDPGPDEPSPPAATGLAAPGGCPRPGDVFNLAVSAEEVLTYYGWTVHHTDGDRLHLTRPGKAGGTSATIKDGKAWVFTSSVSGLTPSTESGRAYSAFDLVAHLAFGGSFAHAARELADRGFAAPGRPPLPWSAPRNAFDPVAVARTRFDRVPAYVPFPIDCLPAPWSNFVREAAAALGCDPALVALPLLSVLAAGAGNSCRI